MNLFSPKVSPFFALNAFFNIGGHEDFELDGSRLTKEREES